ncbi:MAG: hypothetical protein WD404_08080 [Solirubrobacterales bacterium]
MTGRETHSRAKQGATGERRGPKAPKAAAALAAVLTLTLALGVALSHAAKGGDFFIGAPGAPPSGAAADGALFSEPRDSAANHDTGQLYVADQANHRIQRLDADGNFELAWGRDVSESDASGDDGSAFETCSAAADCRQGAAGAKGGMFDDPSGVAVDPDSGDLYVADQDNRRIQRFSFEDNGTPADPSDDLPVFEWAAGSNVVPDGGAGDRPGPSERQTFRFDIVDNSSNGDDPPPSGSFTMSFDGQTSEAVSWPPTQAALQAALEELPNIAPGDVAVSEPQKVPPDATVGYSVQWAVEFAGAYALTDVPLIAIDKSQLANGFHTSSPLIESAPEGDSNPEVCTVAAECRAGVRGHSAAAFNSVRDGSPQVQGMPHDPTALDVSKDGEAGAGRVFVTDPGNRRLMEFGLDGEFTRAWGLGVDSGQSAFEICTMASGCVRGRTEFAGEPNGAFGKDSPRHLAVAADGVLYAETRAGGETRIMRFDTTVAGEDDPAAAALLLPDPYLSASPPNAASPLQHGFASGLEVDPQTGNLLYLVDGSSDTVVQELDTTTNPPTQADVHMESSGSGQSVSGLGLLHGPGGDRLYVSGDGPRIGVIDHRILALTDQGAGPFSLALGEPAVSGIGPNQATLHGTIDAEGPTDFPASYRFEYSPDGEAWIQVPADEGPFSDAEEHALEDTIEGLDANTEYKVRLAGVRAFNGGIAQTTAEQAFTTLAVPAEVQTRDSTLRTDTEATLVGLLHPQNAPTEWRFEWGADDGYGQSTPVEIATGPRARVVTATIEGLDPETTYHYRLVADNGIGAGEDTAVSGEDATVTTRASLPPLDERAYEMVTPPFKVTRTLAPFGGSERANMNKATPSLDGESLAWSTFVFPLTEEVQNGAFGDRRLSSRTASGWRDSTMNTVGVNPERSIPANLRPRVRGSSGDLATRTLALGAGQRMNSYEGVELEVPHEGAGFSRLYTFREGTGHNGYSSWITDTDAQWCLPGGEEPGCDQVDGRDPGDYDFALLNDAGTAMARWGMFRALGEDAAMPGDEDPSDEQQLLGRKAGGFSAYLVRAAGPDGLPGAPRQLINECTGSGAGATLLPNRPFSGPSTTVGTRQCAAGNVVSVRGATVGSPVGGTLGLVGGGTQTTSGGTQTALSDDGNRVFFVAPDAETEGAVRAVHSCTTETGAQTNCPPQLYVRQHGPGGEEFVRWISRSRSEALGDGSYGGAPIALQRMTQLDGGAIFQRASRDGRYVYFQAKMPLVPDDPNGGESITDGKASEGSWDLYRYELPADRSEDPDQGSLLRVSGGPLGTADANASGGALRFASQDGQRAYFLTEAPIEGADETPPAGGTTAPGSGAGARNLYLFDGSLEGAERWRFIARLPSAPRINRCATERMAMPFSTVFKSGRNGPVAAGGGNCFRGTPDARQVVFLTAGALSADDGDGAADVFLYDAERDELERLSAPRGPAAAPYPCDFEPGKQFAEEEDLVPSDVHAHCNAHLDEEGGASGNWGGYSVGEMENARGWNGGAYLNVSRNPDGSVSVYFMSRSQLLPEDVNGDFTDTYEWRAGELSLLTPGNQSRDAWFSGNSLDGEDVFVFTSQRIDPREIDDEDLDYYDLRRGGGFPYTPPPEPCDVLALQCESEAKAAPQAPRAGSLAAGPSGNVAPRRASRRCRGARLRRGKRCVAKRAIARKRCRQAKGRAKRRCVRRQLRRLTKAQKRQRQRAAQRQGGRGR